MLFVLFTGIGTMPYDTARAQILIGGKLEKYRFESVVVEFAILAEHAIVGIGIGDTANKVLKTVALIDILDSTLHGQGRLAHHRRSIFTLYTIEQKALIGLVSRNDSAIVGFGQ